jgi:hypothetical protein
MYIVDAALQCLLHTSKDEPIRFDRKYSVLKTEQDKPGVFVRALFPLVEEVYRSFFWTQLADCISKDEGNLLTLCRKSETTSDTRGRIFESIVINRLIVKKVTGSEMNLLLEEADESFRFERTGELFEKFHRLKGNSYPLCDPSDDNTLYVPMSSNFPAVDAIIHVDKVVIAIQVHTSHSHGRVDNLLNAKAESAGWLDKVNAIILVYLSPTPGNLKRKLDTESSQTKPSSQRITRQSSSETACPVNLFTLFCTIKDFKCLKDIQWGSVSS